MTKMRMRGLVCSFLLRAMHKIKVDAWASLVGTDCDEEGKPKTGAFAIDGAPPRYNTAAEENFPVNNHPRAKSTRCGSSGDSNSLSTKAAHGLTVEN